MSLYYITSPDEVTINQIRRKRNIYQPQQEMMILLCC